jgi:type II secretory pathway component GspD/PulD (secretin)
LTVVSKEKAPVVGNPCNTNSKDQFRTELVVPLRPRIIEGLFEMLRVTDERGRGWARNANTVNPQASNAETQAKQLTPAWRRLPQAERVLNVAA